MMKRFWIAACGVVMLGLLAGCATTHSTSFATAQAGSRIPNGSAIVVGRISFNPQIVQSLGNPNSTMAKLFEHKADVFLTSTPITDIEGNNKLTGRISAQWGKYFDVVVPTGKPFYWGAVVVLVDDKGGATDSLALISPFKISIPKGVQFVYLGDFDYRLNVTNQLGGKDNVLHIRDNFTAAQKKFQNVFLGSDGKPLQLVDDVPGRVGKLKTQMTHSVTNVIRLPY